MIPPVGLSACLNFVMMSRKLRAGSHTLPISKGLKGFLIMDQTGPGYDIVSCDRKSGPLILGMSASRVRRHTEGLP